MSWRGGWSARVVTPSARWSVASLRRTPVSKSLLCAYPRVLLRLQRITIAYQLKLPTAWTIHDVFHASLLTPYRETIEHGANYMRPPPDLIEDTEEYEVKAIVNHRHFGRKRQLQYLVKWKGYPDVDNTWESADHIHTPPLVQIYHQKNPLSSSEQDKKG